MWKKIFALSAMALASPGAASALTIYPNSPTTPTYVTLTGSLALSQTTSVTCNATMYLEIAPGGASAAITGGSFSSGSWQCGWLVLPTGFPWTVTPTYSSHVSVHGVSATSILGSCSGSLSLPVMNGFVDLTYVSMPGSPATCWMNGYLATGQPLNVF